MSDSNTVADPRGSAESLLSVSRQVQIIKQYLERSNDVNTAAACLGTLVRVAAAFDMQSNLLSLAKLLETVAVALDVMCSQCQALDGPTRGDVLELVDSLTPFFVTEGPDFEFVFLLARMKSALALSIDCSQHGDTYGGLVFDIASILLSHHKYDVRTVGP
jgi:hypothetical protein